MNGFANLESHLTKLLRKEQSFHLHGAQEFQRTLTSTSVSGFPDYSAPFVLYTDASARGLVLFSCNKVTAEITVDRIRE